MKPEDFMKMENILYREDQVITRADLVMFLELLEQQYDVILPKYKEERAHLITAIKTVDTLLSWIITGKQRDFGGLL